MTAAACLSLPIQGMTREQVRELGTVVEKRGYFEIRLSLKGQRYAIYRDHGRPFLSRLSGIGGGGMIEFPDCACGEVLKWTGSEYACSFVDATACATTTGWFESWLWIFVPSMVLLAFLFGVALVRGART